LPNRQVNAPLRRSNDLPFGFSRPPILSRTPSTFTVRDYPPVPCLRNHPDTGFGIRRVLSSRAILNRRAWEFDTLEAQNDRKHIVDVHLIIRRTPRL